MFEVSPNDFHALLNKPFSNEVFVEGKGTDVIG